MNLALVDLNLLIVFDALMRERSATRAGARIGLTQPAISNALNRLRHIVKDELFVRGAEGMTPTARAQAIAPDVRRALALVETAFDPVVFDPKTASHTFYLSMADYMASIILPALARRLEKTAPGIDIRVFHNDYVNGPAMLDASEVDLAIGGQREDHPARFKSRILLEGDYVCVMRKDHPLAKKKKVALGDFVAAKHLRVSLTGKVESFVDDILADKGMKRRIGMTVNQFLVAPLVLADSDMILTLPETIARHFARTHALHLSPVPLDLRPSRISLLWHIRSDNNPAQKWIREEIAGLCRQLAAAA